MTAIPPDIATEAQVASVAIGNILDGNTPNGADAMAMGHYGECYREMVRAYSSGGTEAAKTTFAFYAKADATLATLRCGDAFDDGDVGGAAGESGFPWQLRTLRDAYLEREPLAYVVDGLIPRPSLSILYGAPGSLKSMLLGDLCMCIAGGLPWLEPLPGKDAAVAPLKTTQTPVLWVDLDNGQRRCDERFEALGRGQELPEGTPISYVSMPTPWPDASQPSFVENLAGVVERIRAGVVVIDNLGVITGNAQENSGDMAQVMGNLRRLAEENNLAVILIHHQRKSGGSSDKSIRKGETLRGHSSIEAALDLALLVERREGEDDISVIPTKVRGYRSSNIYGATFAFEHKEGTYELHKARFYGAEAQTGKEAKQTATDTAIEDIVMEVLGMGLKNQKNLVEAVQNALRHQKGGSPPGKNRIRFVLDAMLEKGMIQTDKGDKSEKLYHLP